MIRGTFKVCADNNLFGNFFKCTKPHHHTFDMVLPNMNKNSGEIDHID